MAEAPAQLAALGQQNPDGFGLGYIAEGRVEVRKQALPAQGALGAGQGRVETLSDLFVAHVRRSSRAPRALHNTHPFAYGDWLFAHSGALYPLLEVSVRRAAGRQRAYEGHTDSEALFHLLLSHLERTTDPVASIGDALKLVVAGSQFSALNFLLARGDELYAFRHAARSADYYALWWRLRRPGRRLEARSSDTFARVQSQAIAHATAVMVCSERIEPPAPGERWQPIETGELLIVRRLPSLTTESVKLF
jgi:glutamine amidotransferase